MNVNIVHENCDPLLSEDRSLPLNSYIITYKVEEDVKYDIVVCSKVADAFDHYFDKYKKSLIDIKQTHGTIRPNLWGYKQPVKKRRKKRE